MMINHENGETYASKETNSIACNRKMMVQAIKERYEKFDGFVIPHSTDTMAYTAADFEEIFYRSINYDLIFGKNRKCE